MKLHEFQAKQVLARAGIAIPEGRVATTPADAGAAATALGLPVVVKAQVHVGGRGKAGGVKLAMTATEATAAAAAILGLDIKGFTVRTVYVERAARIAKELYLGITVDRDRRRAVVMLSTVGGMEIEEVAATQPAKIARGWPDPLLGLQGYAARALCFDAGVPEAQRDAVAGIARQLYTVFRATDAMTIEINPLFIQQDGSVLAGDAKLEIDDNALYRQPELAKLKETQPDEEQEERAKALGFSYVQLDGEVGIIGNGAGLCLSTLDLVQRAGGRAANFCDLGGGAKAEVVENALAVILMNPHVRGVLMNVFGGITRGDEVAKGLVAARDNLKMKLPLVVRLSGTKEEEGRKILKENGIEPEANAWAAAQKIVELTRVTAPEGAPANSRPSLGVRGEK